MHEHEHSCCKHELKFCSCCDKVYCEKCEMEWGEEGSNCHIPSVYFNTNSLYPDCHTTLSSSSTDFDETDGLACRHCH